VAFIASDEEAAGIDARNLQSIGIARDEAEEPKPETIDRAVAVLGNLPLLILEDVTIEDAFGILAEAYPNLPRAVLLDSLQTCQTVLTRQIDNPRERIDDVVKTVKRHARQPETKAIVVATSELARGAYRNKRGADATNDLAAFKESGGIEYGVHAALVLRSIDGSNTDVHASLAKNRRGTRGAFMLTLDQQIATFADADAVVGGSMAVEKMAAFRQRCGDLLNQVVEATDGITSNRAHEKVGGRKESNLAGLDELRAAGVIRRKGDKGPWRTEVDWRERWAKLQARLTQSGDG
jgi:hypothetical protein